MYFQFGLQRVLFRLAFPFVLPQGLWVKLRAPRFSAAAGPRNGFVGEGRPLRLLLIGDSIIDGVGVERIERAMPGRLADALATSTGACVEWIARGVSGFDSAEIRRELVPCLPEDPFDFIFLSAGVNDVTGLRMAARWRKDLVGLVKDLSSHSPDALIVVSGLPPLHGFPLLPEPLRTVLGLRAKTFDRIAERAVESLPSVLFVPNRFEPDPSFFAPDGYHPSEESCITWARNVAEEIVAWKREREEVWS